MSVTRASKVFFPGDGITKGELAKYYRRIAPTMLPFLRDRPVSMHRYPDGIRGKSFYQKEAPGHFPARIATVDVPRKEGAKSVTHVLAQSAETLVFLAGQGCITPHVWLSRLDRPDRMVFDLDPAGDGTAFARLREAAEAIRGLMEEVRLEAYVMTSGSRGLHVWVPLDRGAGFDDVRSFAAGAAAVVCRRLPKLLTVEQRKAKRRGRIFVDTLRNAYGQTSVPPYAVRGRPGAPVATPLEWSELARPGLGPRRYTIRLAQKDDPWRDLGRRGRSLKRPRRLLDDLLSPWERTSPS